MWLFFETATINKVIPKKRNFSVVIKPIDYNFAAPASNLRMLSGNSRLFIAEMKAT